MSKLTHFNDRGEAHMVNVADKPNSRRIAKAGGRIRMQSETLQTITTGQSHKGDVLAVARIAAIMASKKTAELIPLCHPLTLSNVEIDFRVMEESNAIACVATVTTTGPTGVEMEALTAVQIGLLTIYDMCKAIDRGMIIEQVGLLEKQGGKSGHWQKSQPPQEEAPSR